MPVYEIGFTISGKIKIEADSPEDAQEKFEKENLSIQEFAEQGELEVFDPVLEQVE